jgi:hypothetical protein
MLRPLLLLGIKETAMLFLLLQVAEPPRTPAATPPLPPFEAQVSAEDPMVCRFSARTGTRFKTKTCKRASEWARQREENIRAAREMIDRPVLGPEGD